MLRRLDVSIITFLLLLHAGLLGWAAVGVIEMIAPRVPWPRVSNPLFPPLVLALQWATTAAGALTLLIGWVRRWPLTPLALAGAYSAMAMVCAWQTFALLVHPERFREMATEYVTYVAVIVYLLWSPLVSQRLRRSAPPPAAPA